ncbi:MAG: bifunctional aconitate hydratase 2/2-methylisocitrate dehydratase, partial [Planctomycetes bacterium]|nr:bifunctional aconitate hydratase 2/2-methylisocitrate dehydratase [Planctomycetota bacterium]
MNSDYREHVRDREKSGLPPLPLNAGQVEEIGHFLAEGKTTPTDGGENYVQLLADRVPAGVDPAAKVKSRILSDIVVGKLRVDALPPEKALQLLGAMQGGYNLPPLLAALRDRSLAAAAAKALSGCLLAEDAMEEVTKLHREGNPAASELLTGWADALWFTSAPTLPGTIRLTVYKVDGEVNTDDLSPGKQAANRPDIPFHATFLGVNRFPGGREEMEEMRRRAGPDDWRPAFVADTLGTGSSRKSAVNSLIWLLGRDIPHIPNKRRGGVAIAARIAPIFRDSFEDSGGLPVEAGVSNLRSGQRIVLETDAVKGWGRICAEDGSVLSEFLFSPALADSWRAGGRINLIFGRKLSSRAALALGREPARVFVTQPLPAERPGTGYTLAQKLVGGACGKAGVVPGENCEPAMSTVGSQDTTGPMTRDELSDLACLKFSADLVLQSFCHTAAYPTDRDKAMWKSLTQFFVERGGVALRPGDGIIHSWLNRLLLPDRVGAGGDSHTRFPLGISFAAGSGLVAMAAALGVMPLTMPESVLVEFSGELPAGLTLRDIVNYIPLRAMEQGLLDRPGQGNKNVFNGRVMEMEGLAGLSVEEAFELSCASAERSAAAATIALDLEKVVNYVRTNVKLIESLLADDYQDADTLGRRKAEMEKWLAKPELSRRDPNAEFAARLSVDLSAIKEPVVACPNNPDLVAWLSERSGEKVDEVFIGSCMSNLEHFRAAAGILSGPDVRLGVKRLWLAVPTRMDRDRLAREGVLDHFEKLGARLEIPGCCLCMGNQARVADKAVVF